MSVENFLYKAKKMAEREDITPDMLLRDIHLLLEGTAEDWFFTYVDDFDCWENFEAMFIFRFGNPNRDQGIRSTIQERKQLRGERFITFVTEIEKLNRMLSNPLSHERLFEVIWDNMRPHYKSKIAIVPVNNLRRLLELNYRIDAADNSLQQPTEQAVEPSNRRHVHHVEVDEYGSEEEDEASINAIGGQVSRNRPPYGTASSNQQRQSGGNTFQNRFQQSRPQYQPREQANQPQHVQQPQQPPQQTQQPQRPQQQPQQESGQLQQRAAPVVNQPTLETSRVPGQLLCWNCLTHGHSWRQCDKPKVIFCYGCGNLGRTITNCERCSSGNA